MTSQETPCYALPPSGVIVVDKPQGVTSHDVVAAARKLLHTRKVGHAGTLDPMATGVLVIGFGQATRLLNYIVGLDKTYEATIRFGQATDSDDADGQLLDLDGLSAPWVLSISERADVVRNITVPMLQELINQHFVGNIEQIPNSFSAIKVHGKRAYDLARQGKEVALQARPITISDFTVLSVGTAQSQGRDTIVDVRVRVTCSAGTYIRALARDLGQQLGVGAHLVALRRTRVGQFCADDKRTLGASTASREYVDKSGQTRTKQAVHIACADKQLLHHVLPLKQVVEHTLPVVTVQAAQAQDLRFGRVLSRADLAEQLNNTQYTEHMPVVKRVPLDSHVPMTKHTNEMQNATVQGATTHIAAACTPQELVAIVRIGRHHIRPIAVFAHE